MIPNNLIILNNLILDHTRPACLPLKDSVNADITGTEMVAAGWGKTNDSSSISQFLNKLIVRVVTNDECQQTFGDIVQKTTLCSIGTEGNTGTCQVRTLNSLPKDSCIYRGYIRKPGGPKNFLFLFPLIIWLQTSVCMH